MRPRAQAAAGSIAAALLLLLVLHPCCAGPINPPEQQPEAQVHPQWQLQNPDVFSNPGKRPAKQHSPEIPAPEQHRPEELPAARHPEHPPSHIRREEEPREPSSSRREADDNPEPRTPEPRQAGIEPEPRDEPEGGREPPRRAASQIRFKKEPAASRDLDPQDPRQHSAASGHEHDHEHAREHEREDQLEDGHSRWASEEQDPRKDSTEEHMASRDRQQQQQQQEQQEAVKRKDASAVKAPRWEQLGSPRQQQQQQQQQKPDARAPRWLDDSNSKEPRQQQQQQREHDGEQELVQTPRKASEVKAPIWHNAEHSKSLQHQQQHEEEAERQNDTETVEKQRKEQGSGSPKIATPPRFSNDLLNPGAVAKPPQWTQHKQQQPKQQQKQQQQQPEGEDESEDEPRQGLGRHTRKPTVAEEDASEDSSDGFDAFAEDNSGPRSPYKHQYIPNRGLDSYPEEGLDDEPSKEAPNHSGKYPGGSWHTRDSDPSEYAAAADREGEEEEEEEEDGARRGDKTLDEAQSRLKLRQDLHKKMQEARKHQQQQWQHRADEEELSQGSHPRQGQQQQSPQSQDDAEVDKKFYEDIVSVWGNSPKQQQQQQQHQQQLDGLDASTGAGDDLLEPSQRKFKQQKPVSDDGFDIWGNHALKKHQVGWEDPTSDLPPGFKQEDSTPESQHLAKNPFSAFNPWPKQDPLGGAPSKQQQQKQQQQQGQKKQQPDLFDHMLSKQQQSNDQQQQQQQQQQQPKETQVDVEAPEDQLPTPPATSKQHKQAPPSFKTLPTPQTPLKPVQPSDHQQQQPRQPQQPGLGPRKATTTQPNLQLQKPLAGLVPPVQKGSAGQGGKSSFDFFGSGGVVPPPHRPVRQPVADDVEEETAPQPDGAAAESQPEPADAAAGQQGPPNFTTQEEDIEQEAQQPADASQEQLHKQLPEQQQQQPKQQQQQPKQKPNSPKQQQANQPQQQQPKQPAPQQIPKPANLVAEATAALPTCSAADQVMQCGQLPVSTAEEKTVHRECCVMFAPREHAAQAQKPVVELMEVERWDLEADGSLAEPLQWHFSPPEGSCAAKATAKIPTFANDRTVKVVDQAVPDLTKQQIIQIKAASLEHNAWIHSRYMRIRQAATKTVEGKAAFKHPGGFAGAAELALMQWRLKGSRQPAVAALNSLLEGVGVPPKVYFNGNVSWHPPTDTPLEYHAPLAVRTVDVGYGGFNKARVCPKSYPKSAPEYICSHIAFVEMDGQMSYKQAMAHLATRDAAYANNVLDIVEAWARNNKEWGVQKENGPLEAAWGVAAMARSLEMLKATDMSDDEDLLSKWLNTKRSFVRWYKTVIHPVMEYYIDVITQNALSAGTQTVYGNWHSSIAEAWMAVAVLTDDRTLYDKSLELFDSTVESYFRWGRDKDARDGRIVGECSETLRDLYHSQFGFAGLLQAAEMAWQQNTDLYKSNGYALASALEFHARVINAWEANRDERLLPAGYRFFETSMPPSPPGTDWVFNIQKQKWFARDRQTMRIVMELKDSIKYLLGVKYLPTGWELGYNHFVGRLGMELPETAKLLSRHRVDWHEFHWGLGTLSHANSASLLWRPGVTEEVVCDLDPVFKSVESSKSNSTVAEVFSDAADWAQTSLSSMET